MVINKKYCALCDTLYYEDAPHDDCIVISKTLSGVAINAKLQAEQAYFRALREHWEKHIWNAAIEYIIPIATADYHITAEELRRHKK